MTMSRNQSTQWHVQRVIEFAADLAEVALPWVESAAPVSDQPLFELWEHGRQLTTDWQRRVELLERTTSKNLAVDHDLLLEMLAREVLAIEMPTRLLATISSALDRQRQHPETRPIMEHVLFSIQHVRMRLLTLVLSGDERHAAIDRFRRRCERWTDLLLGPCVVRFGTAAFAHEPRRSWEFGEDLLSDVGLSVSHELVRPSLLSAFRGSAGQSPIQSTFGDSFLRSMITLIPEAISTDRFRRWSATLPTAPLPRNSQETPGELGDESSEGWSLLDRCLRIVESQRHRDR